MSKLNLLEKPLWSIQDIKEYVGCQRTKASEIMSEAKKISVSRFLPSKAKRDNVLTVLGLNFKEEITKLKLLGEEK